MTKLLHHIARLTACTDDKSLSLPAVGPMFLMPWLFATEQTLYLVSCVVPDHIAQGLAQNGYLWSKYPPVSSVPLGFQHQFAAHAVPIFLPQSIGLVEIALPPTATTMSHARAFGESAIELEPQPSEHGPYPELAVSLILWRQHYRHPGPKYRCTGFHRHPNPLLLLTL